LKRLILILVYALAYTNVGISQCLTINLINNPNLEEYTCCPTNMGMIDCATYWTQPLVGNSSSEYYNVCGIDSLLFPNLIVFFDHAYFGNGYAGIVTFSYNPSVIPPSDYREYIQGRLSKPLNAGQCYYGEFWVKVFNWSNSIPYCANDALSIFFSDTLPQRTGSDEMAMFYPSQINNLTGRIISDTSNWVKISGSLIAAGGEKYFTVGNFKLPNEVNSIYFGAPNFARSTYFFDNFSLCPCEDTIPPDTVKPIIPVLEVYPNLANENLFILFNGYDQLQAIDLEIYNILGELVMNEQIISSDAPTSINIAPIASGCYAIVLKNGSSILYKDKLIIIK